MFVKDRMNPDPICGYPEMAVTEAQELIVNHGVRHLPIISDNKNLVGLITRTSLRSALPADISSFSHFEVSYTLSKIKIKSVMIKKPITIQMDIPIEHAARIMADERISCLPVVEGDILVGLISDTNLFIAMTSLLGARNEGLRITIQQPDRSGIIAGLTTAIAEEGGFLAVCVGYNPEQDPDQWVSICKVQNMEEERLVKVINNLKDTIILDIRQFQEQ
ncbi:MAG: CBS domain-containing protein [Anaerolineales bacterium]